MHDHNHSHGSSGRIGWAFFLNFAFTILEFIGGWLTNSTAIMADAVHDLGDTLSIGSAWLLDRLSGRQANKSFTYGYRRFSLLGALINGFVLVVGSMWILSEAIPRLSNPEMPMVEGMFGFAVFGVLVNGFAAYKLSKGETLNEKVLNWHLLEDVLGWVAVLIVSIVLMFVEWPILDPLLSIFFTLFILFNVIKNLIVTLRLFLQAVPDHLSRDAIEKELLAITQVSSIHHLHLWSLDGEHHVLTAHVVLTGDVSLQEIRRIKLDLSEILTPLNFEHTTIEIELKDEDCRDE